MNKLGSYAAFALTGILALMALPASAELSGTVGVTSEYIFRGFSNSGGVAVQGSLDWHNENGFYASAWASNVAPIQPDGSAISIGLPASIVPM